MKIKRIIISSLIILISIIIILILGPKNTVVSELIISVVGGVSIFYGTALLCLTIIGCFDGIQMEKVKVVTIYGKDINKKDSVLTYSKIIRQNLVVLLIPTILMFILAFTMGLYILDYAIYFYFFTYAIFLSMLFFCNKENMKKVFIVDIIMAFIVLLVCFFPIPYDMGKDVIDTHVFINKMENRGFNIERVNKIDNIDVMNSEVYLASKENINVYYVVSDNKKISGKIYDSFDSLFDNCSYGKFDFTRGYNMRKTCDDPVYLKDFSRVKNTILYFDTNDENRELVKDLLIEFGYDY